MSRVTILMYHMVAEPKTRMEARYACPAQQFREQMRCLVREGYRVVSLAEVAAWRRGETTLPERSVAITLDDGFEDNYKSAFPVLSELSIPASIFLVSDLVGTKNTWMSSGDYPTRALMNWEQIKEMSRHGIDFGGHTKNHVDLAQTVYDEARNEIDGCKKRIEDALGLPARFFAYPFGRYNPQAKAIVNETGFELACSTRPGFNRATVDPYELRRIEIYGQDKLWQFKQKLNFGTNESSRSAPMRYYWRRLTKQGNG